MNCSYLKSIILFFLLNMSLLSSQESRIKLYSFYTSSHKEFLENWFLPSIQDDFELIVQYFDQECQTGSYMSKGWLDTMIHKVDVIIQGIEENMGSYFIHSDVDIQFFGPIQQVIETAIKNYDIVLQRDAPGSICAGFFVCRGNNKTLKLWTTIKKILLNKKNKKNDQDLLNHFLYRNQFNISWNFLPDSFFGGGTFTGQHWMPGDDLPIPEHPLMHHANWTSGIANKIAQLEYVKAKVNAREN